MDTRSVLDCFEVCGLRAGVSFVTALLTPPPLATWSCNKGGQLGSGMSGRPGCSDLGWETRLQRVSEQRPRIHTVSESLFTTRFC